jgi:hypothetical protein
MDSDRSEKPTWRRWSTVVPVFWFLAVDASALVLALFASLRTSHAALHQPSMTARFDLYFATELLITIFVSSVLPSLRRLFPAACVAAAICVIAVGLTVSSY